MTEQPNLDKPDLRTDAQKFEGALRTVFTTPKDVVQKRMEVVREQRKQDNVEKQK